MAEDVNRTNKFYQTNMDTLIDNLEELLARLDRDLQTLHDLPPAQVEELTERFLPAFVSSVMKNDKIRHNRVLFMRVNAFFHTVLDVLISTFRTNVNSDVNDRSKLYDILLSILNPDHPFYSLQNIENKDADNELSVETTKSSVVLWPDRDGAKKSVSSVVLQHINYFAAKDGFSLIVKCLAHTSPHVLEYIKKTLHLFMTLHEWLTIATRQQYIPLLVDNIFQCLLQLSEEELKSVRKQDIEEIVSQAETLLKELNHTVAYEKCENFCLDFSLKCFRSSLIEKRVNGLMYIDEAVEMAFCRHLIESGALTQELFSEFFSSKVAKWMRLDWLLQWVQANKIIEDLFGPNTHIQLISKANNLLRHLAKNRLLSRDVLDRICVTLRDPYLMRTTLNTLSVVIDSMHRDDIHYLWHKIWELPVAEVAPELVNFIPKLCENIDIEDVFHLLWRLVAEGSSTRSDVASLARKQFVAIIRGPLRDHRVSLCQQLVHFIESNRHVLASVLVLRDILETFHDDASDIFSETEHSSQMECILILQKIPNLLPILITELTNFVAESKSEYQRQGQQFDIEDHLQQVHCRLDLIGKVIEWLPRELKGNYVSAKTLEPLWQTFFETADTTPVALLYHDLFLDWLRRRALVTLTKPLESLPKDVLEHLFNQWLRPRLTLHSLSMTGFECFRTFFCALNSLRSTLRVSPSDSHEFEVVQYDLLGLDTLWHLVLVVQDTAADNSVFVETSKLLIDLHVRLASSLIPKSDQVVEAFLAKNMKYLQETVTTIRSIQERSQPNIFSASSCNNVSFASAPQEPTSTPSLKEVSFTHALDAHVRLVHRLVNLLNRFLQTWHEYYQKPRRSLLPSAQNENISDALASSLQISFNNLQPKDREEWEKVAQVMDVVAVSELVAVIALRRTSWNSNEAISLLVDEESKHSILLEASKYEVATTTPQNSNAFSPRALLANKQEYFDLLFGLLTLKHIDNNLVWELVSSLPFNAQLETELRELRDVSQWEHLFDAFASPYRLLYTLRIINHFITPSAVTPMSQEELVAKNAWSKLFFRQGGFTKLYSLLQKISVTINDYLQHPAGKQTLVLLLHLLVYFMKGNIKELPFEKEDDNNVPTQNATASQNATTTQNSSTSSVSSTPTATQQRRKALILSTASQQRLSASLDFASFLTLILRLTSNILLLPHTYTEPDVEIVEHALVLVENSVAARTELLQTFYAFSEETYKTVDDLVLALLLYCSHAPIRACAAKHLRLLVMKFDAANIASTFPALRPPHLWLLRLLVDHIPDCNHPAAAHCHEFFELLNTLVSDMICPTETSQGFSASALSELNVDGIAVKLIERIKASPGEMSEQQEDRVLIGCMNVLATILRGKPTLRDTLCSSSATTDLLTEVYDHCLFVPMERIVEDESSTSKQIAESTSLCAVKCKSDAARRAAFALLSELVRDSASNSSELTSRLIAQNYIERRDKPIYYPLLEPQRKSSTGFVGLKNLGSTCYLNSLVQQLFMIPELRLGIFMAMPSLQSQKERSEAVLSMYELAKTFSWLQESERQYYDPTDFARSHKVPIGVPQDADEFFNLLCERIEDALKNTPQKNLLHSIFGGVLQQSVICGENSTHCSERNETFFRLSLHINDKSSLQQALDAFFQSEKLFDYQCEKCAKKVTATKSCVLIHLPNTLIIHLKRFDFDVSRMQRKKLTHRVTFPTSLNMYTYTAEARSERQKILSTVHKPRKDTHLMSSPQSNTARDTADTHDIATAMYELVGIIVHKGTAEAGHYYSFIKNRIRTTTTTITTTTTTNNNNNNSIWYRFDDTIVTPFDSSNLSDDYFEESDTVQLTLDEGMKVNSYILFYQRINCGSASEIVSSVTNPFSAHMLRDVIPQEFKKLIDIDNHLVLAERLRSGPLYLQFMHHTFVQYIKTHTDQFTCMSLEIDIADDVVAMKMIKIVATIVFDTLFRQSQRDWSLIQMWVALLRMLLEHHVPAARWFLARLVSWPFNSQWFEFALLECTESKIREIVADLIKYLLKVIIPFEYALFPSNYPNEERNRREGYEEYPGETVVYEMATKQFDSERILRQTAALPNQFHEITFAQLKGVAVSLRFVDYLIANLESTRPHWQHFQAYFSIWKELWYLGFPMRRYLINRGVIAQMVDYYMGSYSPYYESRHIQRTSLGDSSHMDFKEFVAALANAVCSCYTKVPPDDAAPPPLPPTACPDEPLLPWSCIDRAFLFNESFFDSLLKQGYNNSAVAKIVQHLAWENMALTVWIAQILFQAMWKCEVRQFHNTLNVLEELLNVHDSLQVWRIAVLLNYKNGGLLNVMAKMKNTSDFPALKIDEVLTFLPNLLQSNVLFAGYLFETRQAWAPIVENILLENMRMIQNDKSSKPLTNDKQAELKRYTELLTRYRTFWEGNSDIDCIWDSAFSLSNYPVQEIPGISNKLN